MTLSNARKAVAAVGGAVVAVAALWGFDASEQVQAAIPVITAVLVYLLPND